MKKQQFIKRAVFFLLGVIALVGTANVGFTQGLVEYALILVLNNPVICYGDDCEPVSGEFQAQAQTESDGSASGSLSTTWTDTSLVSHELQINLKKVGDIQFDRYGNLEALDLKGMGTYETSNEPERSIEPTVRFFLTPHGTYVGIFFFDSGGELPDYLLMGPLDGSIQAK